MEGREPELLPGAQGLADAVGFKFYSQSTLQFKGFLMLEAFVMLMLLAMLPNLYGDPLSSSYRIEMLSIWRWCIRCRLLNGVPLDQPGKGVDEIGLADFALLALLGPASR